MWDLPRPGLEPVSPALAGRFSTTAPPGKPLNVSLWVEQPFTDPYYTGGSAVAPHLPQAEAKPVELTPILFSASSPGAFIRLTLPGVFSTLAAAFVSGL